MPNHHNPVQRFSMLDQGGTSHGDTRTNTYEPHLSDMSVIPKKSPCMLPLHAPQPVGC